MILKNAIKDKYLLIVFGLSFLVLAIAAILFYLHLSDVRTPLIIHFDTYKGIIDYVGNKTNVLEILIVAFAVVIINLVLANTLYYRERFFSYLFAFFSLGFTILILIAISVIISVN